MPESGTYGSVRGALSNERPYRDRPLSRAMTIDQHYHAVLLTPQKDGTGPAVMPERFLRQA